MKIGFIGQGWIGKHYADHFEGKGLEIIRYALEPPHNENKDKIKLCNIVFLCVPTPTTPDGFSYTILEDVLKLIGDGNIAIIKSTILPEVTNILQKKYPNIYIFHSPEFLTEATAEYDVAHPKRNIVGIPIDNKDYRKKAQEILNLLPKAPYNSICSAKEAALIKYGGNCFFYTKLIFINMLYDLAMKLDENIDWEVIQEALGAEPMVGKTHLNPIHKGGRGAGNHCLLKDMEAFKRLYWKNSTDVRDWQILDGLISKNLSYLIKSKKDLEIAKGIYGDKIINKYNNKQLYE